MKANSVGGQSEQASWPRVPKIASDEFQQSVAVAELAVRLCELKKAATKVPLEKDNLDPQKFLTQAWELIESARERVLRLQTNAGYLAAHGGSHEAAENVVGRTLSAARVPFENLCNPGRRNKGDTETMKLPDAETGKLIEVEWRVYRSERAFDNLFLAYWWKCREQWKNTDQKNLPEELAALARDEECWKKHGESLLNSWKTNGLPPNDFLALARFRRERDKRAANLPKTGNGSAGRR